MKDIADAKRRKRCTICQLTEPHLWWRSVTLGCCLPTLTPAHKAHQNHSAAKQRQGGWKWDDGRRAIEEYRARNIVGLWAGDRLRVKWVHQGSWGTVCGVWISCVSESRAHMACAPVQTNVSATAIVTLATRCFIPWIIRRLSNRCTILHSPNGVPQFTDPKIMRSVT